MLKKPRSILVQIQPIEIVQIVTIISLTQTYLADRNYSPGISITITLQSPGHK